jgi:hypothetical protein
MNRSTLTATLLTLAAIQGCASPPPLSKADSPIASPVLIQETATASRQDFGGAHVTPVSHVTEVPIEKDAPKVEGHPLTSVVVTQCNLIVAVYMTMADGRLLRFDHSAQLPSDELMSMAYSATRSERVEVSCNDTGAAGYEKHEPV